MQALHCSRRLRTGVEIVSEEKELARVHTGGRAYDREFAEEREITEARSYRELVVMRAMALNRAREELQEAHAMVRKRQQAVSDLETALDIAIRTPES